MIGNQMISIGSVSWSGLNVRFGWKADVRRTKTDSLRTNENGGTMAAVIMLDVSNFR
ncbi:MAG: hypothetical protein ACXWIU_10190 [Limisphaerales bacterium]